MAVKIRLRRMGQKKAPFYRIIVADCRSPRDGRFIDEIGTYDPTTEPSSIKVNEELAKKCELAFDAETVLVKKKERIGGKEIDIKPLIKSLEARFDGVNVVIECILSADASSFLNPEYVVKHMRETVGILTAVDIMSEGYSILRHSAYRDDMSPFR